MFERISSETTSKQVTRNRKYLLCEERVGETNNERQRKE
jgi:hypothetical protein